MSLTLKHAFLVIAILAFIAATVLNVLLNFTSVAGLVVNVLLAIVSIVQGVQWFAEFGPERRSPKIAHTTINKSSKEAESDYLNSRLRAFADEQKLFINTVLTTEIQPQYRTGGQTRQETFDDLQDAVELYKGRFVLVGDPGAGKSTGLRHLMIGAINNRLLHPTDYPLPVWINLGVSDNPVDTNELLRFWWDEQCFLPETPEKFLRQKNVSLFLDGLNEMPEAGGTRKERAAELRKFIDAYPNLPIIITCRIRDYEDDDDLKLGLPVVYVQPLDDDRIQEFISKRDADNVLWEMIEKSDALLRLARNPYNLVMLIGVYKESGTLPASLNDLYGDYVRVTYKHYKERSELKGGEANTPLLRLKLPELERRLKRLAFLMIARGKGTAASYEWARRQIGRTALRDGLNLGVLLRDGVEIKFYHQSLHGYFAVEQLGGALSVKGFRRFAQNPIALIRQIGDLGEAGAPAIEPLISALYDSDAVVHTAAASALVKLGPPAIKPLIDALVIADRKVRLRTVKLGRFGSYIHSSQSRITTHENRDRLVRQAVVVILQQLEDLAIHHLIAALDDKDSNVRSAVVFALGHLSDTRTLQPLIAIFSGDDDYFLHHAAAAALVQLGKPAVQPLITIFTDDEILRDEAADTLVQLGKPAVQPLITIFTDHDSLRDEAADTLVRLGELAVQPLIVVLRDVDADVRRAAAVALGQLGDSRAVQPLISALEDIDADVRRAAAVALGQLGDIHAVQPLIPILEDIDADVRHAAAVALGQLRDIRAVQPLIPILEDTDSRVRGAAAFAFGRLGDTRIVPLLIAALRDTEAVVRFTAAEALGELGNAHAVQPLISVLSDTNKNVRYAVARALGQLQDARAVQPLIIALTDTDEDVCGAAASSLRKIGTSEAMAAAEGWWRGS